MKQSRFLLLGLALLFSATCMQASGQSSDFFAGKWDVLVKGTPNGDAQFILSLERTDGTLNGVILGEGGEETKIERISEGDGSITLNWFAQGYDVSLSLQKVDEDNLKGSLVGMFTASAVRLKE